MEDAKAGRVGRWVFDVDMVAPTLVAAAEKQIKATSGEGLERRKDVMFERLRNTLRRVRPSEEAEHVLTS